jgi:uncharacterized protein YggE
MQNDIDTLTVRTSLEEEVLADRADLVVTIRGSSLVTGSAALNKAREVRQLAEDLAQVGVVAGDIRLLSVSAETSTGVIGKSSTASYRLRVRCTKLDDLADVLGVITGQKNTHLTSVEWGYPDLEPIRDRLLQQGLTRAAAKAALMASALGSRIERAHAVNESPLDADEAPGPRMYRAAAMPEAQRSRMTSEDLGLAVTHSKRIGVQVEVVFRIAPAAGAA